MITRVELEGMGREALIGLAASMGVANARALPRADLADEILLRSGGEARVSRGLFGLARDLLSRVVERGLHLPNAAALADAAAAVPRRAVVYARVTPSPSEGSTELAEGDVSTSAPPPPEEMPGTPAPERNEIATVTLASIYASQGHVDLALATVEKVLSAKPDDGAARSLRAHLLGAPLHVPASLWLQRTATGMRVEWNVGQTSDALAVLRWVCIAPNGLSPIRTLSERVVSARGSMEMQLPSRFVVHAAIGLGEAEGFVSRAHA